MKGVDRDGVPVEETRGRGDRPHRGKLTQPELHRIQATIAIGLKRRFYSEPQMGQILGIARDTLRNRLADLV